MIGVFKSSINVPTHDAKVPSKPKNHDPLMCSFTKLCSWRTSIISAPFYDKFLNSSTDKPLFPSAKISS